MIENARISAPDINQKRWKIFVLVSNFDEYCEGLLTKIPTFLMYLKKHLNISQQKFKKVS